MKNNFLSKSPILISVIISLIVLVIYSEVLIADFVMWDDDLIIYNNLNLGGLSLYRIYWAFTDVDSMMRYNPLTLLSWSMTYHVFGLNPFGYHLVNWLLHGLSSGLLFLIIRKILLVASPVGQSYANQYNKYINIAAVLATLCWTLHPLRVEPVAWATDRTYCQALFFLLLSTLCYLDAVASDVTKKLYITLLVAAIFFYTLSLLSYAIGITFFAVFFILDVFLFKRIGGSVGWWKSQAAKRALLEKLLFAFPAFFIGMISVVVRIKSAGVWHPPVPLSEFGVFERIMQALYVVLYYIWRPFYPIDLSPAYTTLVSFNPQSVKFLFSAFIVAALFVVLFILRKRWPLGLALLLAHFILLIPVMGFLEHPHYHCDRYSLLASICLSILMAFGLMSFLKYKFFPVISISLLIVIVGMLSWLSFHQIKIWNNSERLFTHMISTLKNDPYRQDIYWRLGAYLYMNGREEEAIVNFEKTLAINPHHPVAGRFLRVIRHTTK